MKKLNLILCVILTRVIVSPAIAAPGEPVGDLLDFGIENQEFPANTPFHMQNGWIFSRETLKDLGYAPGHTSFVLEVDHVIVPVSYWERSYVKVDGVFYSLTDFIHNFEDGLPAGMHHFTGHWYLPCKVLLELGWTDECEYPNADIEWDQMDMVVEFE